MLFLNLTRYYFGNDLERRKNWLEPFNAYRRFLKMIIPSYVSALLNYVDGDDDESF